jgi:tRNA nucleotidyltransferase/poly(A) polymerase
LKVCFFCDFSQTNIDRFAKTLRVVNWSEVTDCDDAQTAYNRFSDIFNNFFDLHFPLQYAKPNRNFSKLVSQKNKLRLSILAAHDPSPLNIAAFKQFQNIYNRVVKLAKKLYFEKDLKANHSNLKKTWELMRTAANLPKMNKKGISQILID